MDNTIIQYLNHFLDTRYFTSKNGKIGLFEALKLTKNADPDRYGFSGYGIEFDVRSQRLQSEGSWGKNVVIFGTDIICAC